MQGSFVLKLCTLVNTHMVLVGMAANVPHNICSLVPCLLRHEVKTFLAKYNGTLNFIIELRM